MIINHNLNAMNAHRNMGINNTNSAKSMEKLSSGLRINRAGDDAAGLAISEKMRGQIRGLDQASRNSQDGISLIQTAEGALNETHSILQRMRELATQAANDTNVGVDRTEIQKEMNQLSSEINRIGNTTEFNTKSLLKGDEKVNLNSTGLITSTTKLEGGVDATTVEAKRTDTIGAALADTNKISYTINGEKLELTVATDNALTGTNASEYKGDATANTASIGIKGTNTQAMDAKAVAGALQAMIDKNDVLKGNYKVTADGDNIVIEAVKGGKFEGAAGNISSAAVTGATINNVALDTVGGANKAAVASSTNIDLSKLTTDDDIKSLVGKGMTLGGQQVEFYNANDGAYTGNAIGINISDALAATANKDQALATTIASQLGSKLDNVVVSVGADAKSIDITAKVAGKSGDNLEVKDGGSQKAFEATLQVGANKGQGFKIDINDMRSEALKITGTAGQEATEGAKFTTVNTVTNGTDSTTREAALDVSNYENASSAIKVINNAIETVSAERSKLGAFQNRLEHTIANLGTSSENLTAAESRIRDVDMAKEMMSFSKNNILNQAAQAMLAQANQQPQQVLQLLR